MDANTGDIAAAVLTANDADDAFQVGPLLDQIEGPVASLIGDGADDPTASIAPSSTASLRPRSSCHRAPRPCRARRLRPSRAPRRPWNRGRASRFPEANPTSTAWPGESLEGTWRQTARSPLQPLKQITQFASRKFTASAELRRLIARPPLKRLEGRSLCRLKTAS
jgi:hypothetical protein